MVSISLGFQLDRQQRKQVVDAIHVLVEEHNTLVVATMVSKEMLFGTQQYVNKRYPLVLMTATITEHLFISWAKAGLPGSWSRDDCSSKRQASTSKL